MTEHDTANQTTTLPPWLSMGEVAAYFGVSERSVRRMIAAGELDAKRIGKRLLRVPRASVLALAGAR